ncbi:hypothetical protein [Sulfitobacter sp. M22]|uniref:hypothetical protein n=1 Tax=Sulfitobacter sp. M22 TaxID=2675332 RepID=UPI001F4553DD|nr:hypothetical protein [Sulfitobacter sp. M22]MCF7728670.1 hypothetical protein [Sulfitobacter sp. M22]
MNINKTKRQNTKIGILFSNQSEKNIKPDLIGYADLEYGRVMLALKVLNSSTGKDYLLSVVPWSMSVKAETQVLLRPSLPDVTKKGFPLALDARLIWCGTAYALTCEVEQKNNGLKYLKITFQND